MDADTRAELFLSFSHQNGQEMTRLKDVLESHGAIVNYDYDRISVAQQLNERIPDLIGQSNGFVLIWSRLAAQSEWVSRELELAVKHEKHVIPQTLDGTALPVEWTDIVHAEQDDFEHCHAMLLRAVFGPNFQPGSLAQVFPGHWEARCRPPSIGIPGFGAQFETSSSLDLLANGRLELSGQLSDDAIATFEAAPVARVSFKSHGKWSYHEDVQTLVFETNIENPLGRRVGKKHQISITWNNGKTFGGEEIGGQRWEFRREPSKTTQWRPKSDDDSCAIQDLPAQLDSWIESLRSRGSSPGVVQQAELNGKIGIFMQDVLENGTCFQRYNFTAGPAGGGDDLRVTLQPFAVYRDEVGNDCRCMHVTRVEEDKPKTEWAATYVRTEEPCWHQVNS